jgi:hypothetical protein
MDESLNESDEFYMRFMGTLGRDIRPFYVGDPDKPAAPRGIISVLDEDVSFFDED